MADQAKCDIHGTDIDALKKASESANIVFIITLVLAIICCLLSLFAQFKQIGFSMVIAASLFTLVLAVVSGVFFFKKQEIDECQKTFL